jgi:hypothetical protein
MRALAAGLVLTAMLLVPGCGPARPVCAWFVDALVKVFPDTGMGRDELRPVELAAARGAHVSVQLALHSETGIGDLFVDALPLSGPGMPIEQAEVRRVEWVVVTTNTPDTPPAELLRRAPALFPDALVATLPMTVEKGKTRAVWVTIAVPTDQTPGLYRGELRLRQGVEEIERLPYTLEVKAATIPEPIPLEWPLQATLTEARMKQFFRAPEGSDEWNKVTRNIERFWHAYHASPAQADVRASGTGRGLNVYIDNPLVKTRQLAWLAFTQGAGALPRLRGVDWGPQPMKDTQPVFGQETGYPPPGDAYLTYPDRDARSLSSSIRLEQLREGAEDYGLLVEFGRRHPEAARALAARMVRSPGNYMQDVKQFRAIQRELLDAATR